MLPTITTHATPNMPQTLNTVLLWDLRRHIDCPQEKTALEPRPFFYKANKIFPIVYSLLFPPTDNYYHRVQYQQKFDRYMQEYQRHAKDLRNPH